MQVEAADVERQFGLQHPKEAFDVLDALGQGVRGEGDAPIPEFGYSPRARFVAGSEIERVGVWTTTPKDAMGGGPLEKAPQRACEPISRDVEGTTQDIILSPEAFSQSRADKNATSKVQTIQLFIDKRKIFVIQLTRKHRK